MLTLIGAFWPGSDSSGPNHSFKGLAAALADEFDFLLLARDRPFGAATATAEGGRWIDLGYASARYCEATGMGARGLRRILAETPYDILVLSSFFDPHFTIAPLLLRRLGLVARRPTIVSPRGEFTTGALGLKSAKKAHFLHFARAAGLYRDVLLQATSEPELEQIRTGFPWARDYAVAGNVRSLIAAPPHRPRKGGPLRLAFFGRITPVKNLRFAIEALSRVTRPVAFRIFGPPQDSDYWASCERAIAALPAHVRVHYEGEIANAHVPRVLAETDLLFMPSRSENFGHAIFEALCCGVPVLIGDQTPWRNLAEQEAGWDLPLDRPDHFSAVIDAAADLPEARHSALRLGARRTAEAHVAEGLALRQNRAMLRGMLRDGGGVTAAAPARVAGTA